MTSIQVDPEGLAGSGRSLEYLAARFMQALSAFQSELGGFGAPWGQDEIGSLIGAAHEEVSAWAFECYQSALEEIAAAGVDLADMGEGYAMIEENIQHGFERLHQDLEG